MKLWWFKGDKDKSDQEHQELQAAKRKAEDLDRRANKLKQDNHFIVDVKRTLGAQ